MQGVAILEKLQYCLYFLIISDNSECMRWQPINNLPQDWQKLASSELPPLVTVWNEQADRLRNSGAFKIFMEKMRREIAIETGIIERLYTKLLLQDWNTGIEVFNCH